MKMRRSKILVEPPAAAISDLAFILIVFFLVCASVEPDAGRPQIIPKAEQKQDKEQQSQNIEVAISRGVTLMSGEPVTDEAFVTRLRQLLAAKTRPEDRVVVVKSKEDVPYHRWIFLTGKIEEAGGTVTLEIEEQQTQVVN